MAKALQFACGDQTVAFEIGSKIDKKALYGYARRIAEKDGKELERGVLLADGRMLPRQALGWLRCDPEGSVATTTETLIDGVPAVAQPSSFDRVSALQTVPMTRLAEFSVRDVYPLAGTGLAPGLYRTEFCYRASPQPNDALVLVRADECFLLVGTMKVATHLALAVTYEFFDADDAEEDADELDFSMV